MIQTIGIIGAGQMGNGIAHVCALAGYDILLYDSNADQRDRAMATIHGNLKRQVARQKISEDEMNAALARIKEADSLDAFANVDLAVEAATEDEQVKRQIFAELCPMLPETALIATNSSSISIARLAAAQAAVANG